MINMWVTSLVILSIYELFKQEFSGHRESHYKQGGRAWGESGKVFMKLELFTLVSKKRTWSANELFIV